MWGGGVRNNSQERSFYIGFKGNRILSCHGEALRCGGQVHGLCRQPVTHRFLNFSGMYCLHWEEDTNNTCFKGCCEEAMTHFCKALDSAHFTCSALSAGWWEPPLQHLVSSDYTPSLQNGMHRGQPAANLFSLRSVPRERGREKAELLAWKTGRRC